MSILPKAIWIPFISFSALIAVAKTSKTMLNNSGESRHPCLVSDFRGNAFNFFTIEDNVCGGFVIYSFYYLREMQRKPLTKFNIHL